MKKSIILPVIVLLVAVLGVYWFSNMKSETDSRDQIACTQDAKLCPDGSFVSHTGPNCEFAECPSQKVESDAAIDTSNWKTYRNEEYEFEFKYPSEWKFSDYTKGFKNLQTLTFSLGDYEEGVSIDVNCWVDNPTESWGFYSQSQKEERQIHIASVDTKVFYIEDNFIIPLLKKGQYEFGKNNTKVTYQYCGLQLRGTYFNKAEAAINSFSFIKGFDTTINKIAESFRLSRNFVLP